MRTGTPQNEPLLDRLLTIDEAAAILRCSRFSLNKWRITGSGPAFVYVGRRVRYRRADLAAFIVTSTRRSTSDPGGHAVSTT
jgi:excisionase family DNA binding protein